MVVLPGVVVILPPATGVFAPIPWSILKLVAPELVHESVEAVPAVIDVGDAASVQLGTPTTETVAVQFTEPAALVAV